MRITDVITLPVVKEVVISLVGLAAANPIAGIITGLGLVLIVIRLSKHLLRSMIINGLY